MGITFQLMLKHVSVRELISKVSLVFCCLSAQEKGLYPRTPSLANPHNRPKEISLIH